ncbi:MAG: cell division protein CrgA [Actinomycetota bacterium]
MPKSRSRPQPKRRYGGPAVQRKSKRRSSPRWFGGLILGLMFSGVIVIVLNYMDLMPGFTFPFFDWVVSDVTNNFYLLGGLGLIATGFLLATQWY